MIIGIVLLLVAVGIWFVPSPVEMTALTVAGFGLLSIAYSLAKKFHLKRWVKRGMIVLGIVVFLILSISTIVIVSQGESQWEQAEDVPCAVVLGAQIWGMEPSPTLQRRLDVALTWMEENPKGIVVVSGGQGDDEMATEGSVMKTYMVSHGGEESRIVTEEKARNTRQNLLFSQEILEDMGYSTESLVVITSDFHVARARYIADQVNIQAVGLASPTTPAILKWNLALREVFAFVKAALMLQ